MSQDYPLNPTESILSVWNQLSTTGIKTCSHLTETGWVGFSSHSHITHSLLCFVLISSLNRQAKDCEGPLPPLEKVSPIPYQGEAMLQHRVEEFCPAATLYLHWHPHSPGRSEQWLLFCFPWPGKCMHPGRALQGDVYRLCHQLLGTLGTVWVPPSRDLPRDHICW